MKLFYFHIHGIISQCLTKAGAVISFSGQSCFAGMSRQVQASGSEAKISTHTGCILASETCLAHPSSEA